MYINHRTGVSYASPLSLILNSFINLFSIYFHRCGEDERPLNELLVLVLGAEHLNGCYNISMCKIFGNHWNQAKRRFPGGAEDNSVMTLCYI